MKKHYRKENDCLNCGTILEGKYCHNCGQENLEMKESFGHMMNHAISDYFHFDHQFFSTLKPLFTKPGFLTNEYMAGRRASYLHPVKMYIFISLVYFVILFQTGHQMVNMHVNNGPQSTQKIIDSVMKDPEIPAYIKKSLIAKIKKDNPPPASKHNSVNFMADDKEANEKSAAYFLSPTSNDSTYQAYLIAQQKLPEQKRDGIIERYYNEKAYAYKAKYGSRTQEVVLDEFKHNIPKMMFLLLPICALILMVTFRNNKKYYVEHLIYSFHLHCFLFLFLAIIMLLQWLIPSETVDGLLSFLAFATVVWYIYRSLKVVYGRSGWRTLTKMAGMSVIYLLSFVSCLALAFILTAILAV
jgi:hypothetical protein